MPLDVTWATSAGSRRLLETAFRLARFGLVGIVATLVHLGVVVSLVESGVLPEPLVANLFAFSCAVFVSYYGHNYWTFRQRRGSVPQFLRFLVITVMALGLNQLILYVVTRPLGLDYRIGLLLVLCLVPLFTYALSHFWVFRENCGA